MSWITALEFAGALGILALGLYGNPPRKIGFEGSFVEVACSAGDSVGAAHGIFLTPPSWRWQAIRPRLSRTIRGTSSRQRGPHSGQRG